MGKKVITDEQIEAIREYIKNRNTLQIRKILNELKEDEFKNKIKSVVRNLGKSNMIMKDKIEELIREDE